MERENDRLTQFLYIFFEQSDVAPIKWTTGHMLNVLSAFPFYLTGATTICKKKFLQN